MLHPSTTSKIWYTSNYRDASCDNQKPQLCIVQNFHFKTSWSLSTMLSRMQNYFFLHFKRYNLAIYAVNIFEGFSTHSSSSMKEESTPNVRCTLWWGLARKDTSFTPGPWTRNSSSSSMKEDPTFEDEKKPFNFFFKFKISILWARNGSFEVLFEKYRQGIL
jgi:hypothetical protein